MQKCSLQCHLEAKKPTSTREKSSQAVRRQYEGSSATFQTLCPFLKIKLKQIRKKIFGEELEENLLGEVIATSGLSPTNNGAQTFWYSILKGVSAKYLTNAFSSCSRLTHFKLSVQVQKKKILAACLSRSRPFICYLLSFFSLPHYLPRIYSAPGLSANPISCSP